MDTGLANKVAIVTGGNSGIGEATVHCLAREGVKVAILARREPEGLAVEHAVRAAGGEATFIACDVMQRPSVETAVGNAIATYGGLHILFNNAGGVFPDPFPAPGGDEAFEQTLRLSLTGTYRMCQTAWPHLVRAGGAAVVNMSSVAAVLGVSEAQQALFPFLPPPGLWAAKAGVEALTRYLASVGAPHRIRVNAVRPGQVLAAGFGHGGGRHFAWRHGEQTQLVRGAGSPEDVGNAVVFVASEASRFINAQIISIDGGTVAKV
jgi:NAD(P)-dependent dehydrogenase (short-subunit alcohol dehydrogenase family)